MKTVYKYAVPMLDMVTLTLPADAQVLRFGAQGDEVFAWALIDRCQALMKDRSFRIAGTGHPIDYGNLSYVNTFEMLGGKLVFHAFEVIE